MSRRSKKYSVYVKRKFTETISWMRVNSSIIPEPQQRTLVPDRFSFHSKHSSINKAKAKCIELKLMDETLHEAQVRRLGNVLFRI